MQSILFLLCRLPTIGRPSLPNPNQSVLGIVCAEHTRYYPDTLGRFGGDIR